MQAASFIPATQRPFHKNTLTPRCRLEGSPIRFEYLALHPGNRPLVDQMWRLYLANGQRHGFAVLSRRDFYRVHLGGTPGLTVLLARVRRAGGRAGEQAGGQAGVRARATGGQGECW